LTSPFSSAVSTASSSSFVRPALIHQTGGACGIRYMERRRTRKMRKMRGGFSPSVMGAFVKNVEALAAPVSMYLAYKMFKGKGKTKTKKGKSKKV